MDDESFSHFAFVEAMPIAEASRLVARYQAAVLTVAPVFEDLPEPMQRVLRLCDGVRNSRAIALQSGLSPGEATLLLDQLVSTGLVTRVDGPLPERRRLSDASRRWLGLDLPGHAGDLDFGELGDAF